MLTWGANENGQLGVGDTQPRITPMRVLTTSTFSSLSCGSRTTLGVTLHAKSVLGFGHAGTHMLGEDVEDECVCTPRTIESLERIVSVATRGAHALAVNVNGELFVWGRGEEQDQQSVTSVRPVFLPGVFVSKIAVGRMHSVCLDSNGAVYTWGSSDEGQCGMPASAGGYVSTPTKLPNTIQARDIACGSRHTLVLSAQGNKIWGFGGNAYSQLGLGDKEPRFFPCEIKLTPQFYLEQQEEAQDIKLACGYRHSFVYSRNRAWGFGWNSHKQTLPNVDGIVSTPTLLEPIELGWDILQIAGGGRHTLVLTCKRNQQRFHLWAFGRGVSGELGVETCPSVVSEPQLVLGMSTAPAAGDAVLPIVACGWEHSVITLPQGFRLDTTSPNGSNSSSNGKRKILLQFRGDFDAGMAQFVNALVLLRLMPGGDQGKISVGMAICLGNLLFAFWAFATGRTALPHGINTIAFFALYNGCYNVVLQESGGNVVSAGEACLFCTVVLAILQFATADIIGPVLKRYVPRSALQATVAGIALSFISLRFVAEEFELPSAGLGSLVVLLVGFAARERMPFGLPVALVSLVVGWFVVVLTASSTPDVAAEVVAAVEQENRHLSVINAMLNVDNYPYLLSIVLPLFLVNVVNNLSCVDQARTSGDLFSSSKALQLDAIATFVGAVVFQCPFPTCIYVGHASFKAMGASHLFSIFNAILVLALVLRVPEPFALLVDSIPQVCTVGMLVWIGVVLTSDAFKNKKYNVAVVIGLLPAMAAAAVSDEVTPGLKALGEGYMLVSLVLASAVSHIIDRRFLDATVWFTVAAAFSLWGWIHTSVGFEMGEAYLVCAAITAAWTAAQWHESELDQEKR